ncbi:MAG: fasciclin domain-containing protein [Pseudomonadota bacterium]
MTPIKTALASAALLLGSTAAMATTVEITNGELLDENETIVENAVKVANFSTLVTAVTTAGLADDLSSEGPFTVFAPLDSAFANLPEGTVETLLQSENREQLITLLGAHVVPAKIMAEDISLAFVSGSDQTFVSAFGDVVTLDGDILTLDTLTEVSDLLVTQNGSDFYVSTSTGATQDAEIIATDIVASNGVIHIVDKVLAPIQ